MSIQVKVVKATSAFPWVGRVLMVEPNPRVRILIKKGYLQRLDVPVFNPVVLDEPDVEVPVLVDDVETEGDGAWVGTVDNEDDDDTEDETDEDEEDDETEDEEAPDDDGFTYV